MIITMTKNKTVYYKRFPYRTFENESRVSGAYIYTRPDRVECRNPLFRSCQRPWFNFMFLTTATATTAAAVFITHVLYTRTYYMCFFCTELEAVYHDICWGYNINIICLLLNICVYYIRSSYCLYNDLTGGLGHSHRLE